MIRKLILPRANVESLPYRATPAMLVSGFNFLEANMSLTTYAEKLQDSRWQRKRLDVMNNANWRCEEPSCKSPENCQIQTHHCYYIKGKEPWEYDGDLLMALCDSCHQQRQKVEIAIHVALARIMRKIPLRRLEKAVWEFVGRALQEVAA